MVAGSVELQSGWTAAQVDRHHRIGQHIVGDGQDHRSVVSRIGKDHRNRFGTPSCRQQGGGCDRHLSVTLSDFSVSDAVCDLLPTPREHQAATGAQVVRQRYGHQHLPVINDIGPFHATTEFSRRLQSQNSGLLASLTCWCNGVHRHAAGGCARVTRAVGLPNLRGESALACCGQCRQLRRRQNNGPVACSRCGGVDQSLAAVGQSLVIGVFKGQTDLQAVFGSAFKTCATGLFGEVDQTRSCDDVGRLGHRNAWGVRVQRDVLDLTDSTDLLTHPGERAQLVIALSKIQ